MTHQTYQFDKAVAENIVWAEVRHFANHIGLHGYSEDEVQTLTRAIQFRVDKDIPWTDVDALIQARIVLDHLTANDAGFKLVSNSWANLAYDVSVALGHVRPRLEVAA